MNPNYAELLARHMDTYSQGSAPPGNAAEQALANQEIGRAHV